MTTDLEGAAPEEQNLKSNETEAERFLREEQHGNPRWGHYPELKAQIIAQLGGKCAKCGSIERLEVDHIDPKKKRHEVSALLTMGDPKVLAREVKKCEVLCHVCHLDKTILERGQRRAMESHPSLSSYRYCKCDLCREVHSAYCTKWNKRAKRNRKRRALARRKRYEAL